MAEYGPFKYPSGLRLVSPIFWVNVRDPTFTDFLKPIEVTIPHCLDLTVSEFLGLTFLKTDDHINAFDFYKVEGMVLKPGKKYPVLTTTHLNKCSLCIAGQISQLLNTKTIYSIYAAISRTVAPTMKIFCRFYVSLNLPTCSKCIKEQLDIIPEFKGHTGMNKLFTFSSRRHHYTSAVEMLFPIKMPTGWMLLLSHKIKVNISFYFEQRFYNLLTDF